MAMNDPVLQRSMFSGPRSAPSSPAATGTGVGSLTTPDQNAQALRGLFRAPPSMAFPAPGMQPVQSFQTGGLAERLEITPPPILAEGPVSSEAPAAPPPSAPAAPAGPEAPREYPIREGIRSVLNRVFPPRQQPAARPAPAAAAPAVPPLPAPVEVGAAPGMSYPSEPPPSAAPSVSTSLEEIRSRREAKEAALTAAERRENGLLALMQAGFATAAGTSPNALSNIGAGGQAGIAAFANLEKSRREDAAARRREQLSREISTAQLQKEPDQIRTLAMIGGWTPDQGREGLQAAVAKGMQIQRSTQPEPDQIRTYRILGGGDVRKGFEIYNADKRLQAAIAVTKDITAADEDRKAATEYIRTQLMQTRTGGATAFPGFSATPVP